jgi:YidC/Oxa1 family membrane protein insertase
VFQVIANILAWFYQLTHSYAGSIALLTLSVMVLLTPLTLKGTKSMIQMQRLQPEIKKLQAQYKGDRQRLNEETMRFYQENKINPLGGCLPLLIQIPVFIILYRVIGRLTSVNKATGNFNPSYISKTSELYKSLSKGHTMKSFGIDLSESTVKAIQDSFGRAIPYLVLVFLVGLTSWYQQRQIMARQTGQSVNPQQQMIMKIVPFIWPVILLNLPAALAVYGLVSNLYRVTQQGYITRHLYRPALGNNGVIEAKVVDAPKPDRAEPRSRRSRPDDVPKGRDAKPAPSRGSVPKTPSRVTPGKAKAKPKPPPSGRVGRPDPRKK